MSARYAIWKGEKVIAVGTAYEIAAQLAVAVKTVYWWASPAAKRRADEGNHPRGRKVAERIN